MASEVYPLAKTGGLADVCAALPQALAALGVDVRLIVPGYESALDRVLHPQIKCNLDDILGIEDARLVSGEMPDSGIPVLLVDVPRLYRRAGSLYQAWDGSDWLDNDRRFAVFCHAAARIALGRADSLPAPDLVHCHDWHAGLVPLLLRGRPKAPPSVFTVHNMAFQGNFPPETFERLGLPAGSFGPDGVEFYGQVSFLKAGLQYADYLSTVSRRYAREVQTQEFGHGLDGLMRRRARRLCGIVNGIDTALWNPHANPWLPERFSDEDLAGKRICKRELQVELGLRDDPEAVLAVSACRLTHQKMIDVVADALPEMLARWPHLQFALLGQGERHLERRLAELAGNFPGRISVRIGYDEPEVHRLIAGADALLHGSRFEPCGLVQLYAMRYGAVPVVRRIGGLADTVRDVGLEALPDERATGFSFAEASREDMIAGLERAVAMHRQPPAWRKLQMQGMRTDFGWQRSARAYLRLYRALAARRRPGLARLPDGPDSHNAAGTVGASGLAI
ncbi:MAG TPA: glycogen synthase GlgA [Alphaproteobacteria bacterium]|nr:glycogen synthase GlgA [Alphaproteobacteria bacterium]